MVNKKLNGWDKIYCELGIVQKEIMPVIKKFSNLLLKRRQKNYKLLDCGCGTGRHSVFLANKLLHTQAGQHIQIEALDMSNHAIRIFKNILQRRNILTKNTNLHINLSVHDLNKRMPYKREYFDSLVSTLVIQHGLMSQIKRWCNEMKRVLKKGGLLSLAVISTNDPRYNTGKEIEPGTRINTDQKDGHVPHHFFTDVEIENYLFKNFKVLYKKNQRRKSATANLIARHWEYILKK